MDCIAEAKKFIERAQEASNKEVINQHLAMADWYLNEALKERDEEQRNGQGQPELEPSN
jgi:hypothetical protein